MFGEIWKDKYKPISGPATFPEGSVSFKLLFTQADEHDLPYIKGSPTWKATIAQKPLPFPSHERTKPVPLHLIQLDIAVRDTRADATTGWIFGTFMYHNSIEEENPWKRLMPVCLMWGNDPNLTKREYDKGHRPKESWVNPKAKEAMQIPRAKRPYLGWLDRGNGPVDNYISSCISCHSTANNPRLQMTWTAKDVHNEERQMLFFRNVPAGEPFGFVGDPLDYSLQLMVGIDNYIEWEKRWITFLSVPFKGPALPLSKFPEHKLAARGIVLTDYSDEEMNELA